ncbi:MAG: hypothetical protein AABY22_21490 [Nanoarchaeota archaeon]
MNKEINCKKYVVEVWLKKELQITAENKETALEVTKSLFEDPRCEHAIKNKNINYVVREVMADV